jgi:chromosome segregation ATPase
MSSEINSPNNGNGWTNLIASKRSLSKQLRELTTQVIQVDSTISEIGLGIKAEKARVRDFVNRINTLRENIANSNTELFQTSERISQSKGFLSLMQNRLPKEDANTLQADLNTLRTELDDNARKSEIKRNDALERYKRTTMALEAIKAVTTVNEQCLALRDLSKNLTVAISKGNYEISQLESNITQSNNAIDRLVSSKAAIQEKRESMMLQYNKVLTNLESVNRRLDSIAKAGRNLNIPSSYLSQGKNYDLISEFKQGAQKKLKAGEKLTLDELRMVFQEEE